MKKATPLYCKPQTKTIDVRNYAFFCIYYLTIGSTTRNYSLNEDSVQLSELRLMYQKLSIIWYFWERHWDSMLTFVLTLSKILQWRQTNTCHTSWSSQTISRTDQLTLADMNRSHSISNQQSDIQCLCQHLSPFVYYLQMPALFWRNARVS